MEKLQKLIQDELGGLFRTDGNVVSEDHVARVGKLKTLVIQHPCVDISTVLDEMAQRNSLFIPKNAHAYVASDFNGDTQYIRGEKALSVYAVQFYHLFY